MMASMCSALRSARSFPLRLFGQRFSRGGWSVPILFLVMANTPMTSSAAARTKRKAKPAAESPVKQAEPEAQPEAQPDAAAEPKVGTEQTTDAPASASASTVPTARELEHSGPSSASTVPAAEKPQPGGLAVFLEAGVRWDLGNFSRNENVGLNESNQNDAIAAWDPMFHIGILSRRDDVWRIGGAFGYGGNYSLNNNDRILGQLLTADFRVEARKQISEAVWLFAQPKVGVSAIIPGGLLQDRISANQRFGYDTWSGPRWGFLVGVDAGARYVINDWLALRGSVGYAWTMSFLLDSKASTEQVSASQSWQIQASRLSGNLGVEASF